MKKALFIVPVLALTMALGCTAPTQTIAVEALKIGVTQEHSIVNDLAVIAKQSTTNEGVAEARFAVTQGNADAAEEAVEKAVTQFDKIDWLLIQHERARAMLRIGQIYVWSQEGIFDIMKDEIEEAKKRSDAKDIPEITK